MTIELPEQWRKWPTAIEVGFHYTERNAISRDDYAVFDALGLEYGADDTLAYLWKRPNGPLGFRSQLRLATAGRTISEAIEAYDFLAPQLRKPRRHGLVAPSDVA